MKQKKRVTLVCGMPHVITETVENNELLKRFINLNITATEQDINEFGAIDNESSHGFQEEILEEASFFFVESSK